MSFTVNYGDRPLDDEADGDCGKERKCCGGMPVWNVTQPFISLWLHDEPLGYQPALGPRISLKLAYKQRESSAGYETNIFSFGKKWNCDWFSFVEQNALGIPVVHFPNGTERKMLAISEYLTYTRITGDTNNGFTVSYADGSKDVYGMIVTNGSGEFLKAFRTEAWTPQSQKTRFDYLGYTPTAAPVIRLKYVVDGDDHTNTLDYVVSNPYSTNLVSQVTDPFGRTASFLYDHLGRLTNLTDVAGISSSVRYDSSDWATNLITPYGTTEFQITDTAGGQTAPNGRSVRVLEPDGSAQLYLFTNSAPVASSYAPSLIPVTTPFANKFDTNQLNLRNSFHWNASQYAALSNPNIGSFTANDFYKARMKHWLIGYGNAVGPTLSMVREASQDSAGSVEGQKTWYDYADKVESRTEGSQYSPLFVGQVLPDGTTYFVRTVRNGFGATTNEVSTYTSGGSVALRTNRYFYATNEVDLIKVTNALNIQISSNAYNAFHQVITNFNALGEKTVYTFDGSQRLSTVAYPSGLNTTNIYGTDGFLAESRDIGIATNIFTWANNLVFTHTDPRGLRITNTWDALQRLLRVDYPDNTFITNTYDKLDLIRVIDRMGFTNTFGYDSLRRKIAETNANNVATRYGYCSCGASTSTTNAWSTPAEFAITNTLDLQGNLIYKALPDVTLTNWYDALGRVICTGDGWGYRWFFYNNQGLLTVVSNAFGAEQITTYDILDRPQFVTDANGVMITNTYDNLNRLRTRGYPDGGVEKFGYSTRGMVAYTNQLGFTNFFVYDEAGRKMFETNANFELIRYTNSPAGDLIALVDGKSQVTKWNYDEYGRATNKVDQAGNVALRYTYDADGRLISRWSNAKGTTYYTNDAVGNVTYVNYPSGTDVTFAYDWLNRVTNMVDAVGATKYTYAVGGQLYTEDGPFASDTLTNIYWNLMRTNLSLLQPTGVWTNALAYDVAKRLTNVTSSAGVMDYYLAATAAGSSLIRKVALPNTSYITNVYDSVARLKGTWLNKNDNTTLDYAAYNYNLGNQRINSTNGAGTYATNTYDRIGQLKLTDPSAIAERRSYVYDAAWNMTQVLKGDPNDPGGEDDWGYNAKNEISGSAEESGITYDANGNMVARADGYRTYTYDAENRLIGWHLYTGDLGPEGDPVSGDQYGVFQYDGLGRLRTATSYLAVNCPDCEWAEQSNTEYVYDGMRVIQERDGSNVPTVSYTRGTDLSGSLEGAGGIGGLLARSHGYSSGNWTTHNYYHADGNGNITYLESSSQTLSASYVYDPFGNTISQSGGLADANVYRFSSKEYNAFVSFYYYGYRWYVPGLHRWLNRDPIGELGGINLYGFVKNQPISLVDPLGLAFGNPVPSIVIRSGPPAVPHAVIQTESEVAAWFGGLWDGIKQAVSSAEYLKCQATCSLDKALNAVFNFVPGANVNVGQGFLYDYGGKTLEFGFDDTGDAVIDTAGATAEIQKGLIQAEFAKLTQSKSIERMSELLSRKGSNLGSRATQVLQQNLNKALQTEGKLARVEKIAKVLAVVEATKGFNDCYEKYCAKCLKREE